MEEIEQGSLMTFREFARTGLWALFGLAVPLFARAEEPYYCLPALILQSVTPDSAAAGAVLTLHGDWRGTSRESAPMLIGPNGEQSPLQLISRSDTDIQARLPKCVVPGSYHMTVYCRDPHQGRTNFAGLLPIIISGLDKSCPAAEVLSRPQVASDGAPVYGNSTRVTNKLEVSTRSPKRFLEEFHQAVSRPEWWDRVPAKKIRNVYEYMAYQPLMDHSQASAMKTAYQAIENHPDDAYLCVMAIPTVMDGSAAPGEKMALGQLALMHFGDFRIPHPKPKFGPADPVASVVWSLAKTYNRYALYDQTVQVVKSLLDKRKPEIAWPLFQALCGEYAQAKYMTGDTPGALSVLAAAMNGENGNRYDLVQKRDLFEKNPVAPAQPPIPFAMRPTPTRAVDGSPLPKPQEPGACTVIYKGLSVSSGPPGTRVSLLGTWNDHQGPNRYVAMSGKGRLEVLSWNTHAVEVRIPYETVPGLYTLSLYCDDLRNGPNFYSGVMSFEVTGPTDCGIKLDRLNRLQAAAGETLELYGEWGQSQGTRFPVIKRAGIRALDVISWDARSIKVRVPRNSEPGEYSVGVYCDDPRNGAAPSSGFMDVQITK